MKDLVETYKNEGFQAVLMKVPRNQEDQQAIRKDCKESEM